MNRMMSFPRQRVIFTFAVFGIAFCFTTALLWSHIEKVIGPDGYQGLAKAGLILLPVVALIMTIWELFVDHVGPARKHALHPTVKRLVDWCFIGSMILLIAELVHAGAILKYESSTGEQKAAIAAVGDAQAKIVGETARGAMEGAGAAAQKLNAVGQTRTAGRLVDGGKTVVGEAQAKALAEVAKVAEGSKPSTFLPAWYVGGGMYVALPVLAALFFGLTMAFARVAAPYVDADDDGRPDATQGGPENIEFQYFDSNDKPVDGERWEKHPVSAAVINELKSLKSRRRTPRQLREDEPPSLQNAEWRRRSNGWELWRFVGDGDFRYAGTLTHDAWQEIKEEWQASLDDDFRPSPPAGVSRQYPSNGAWPKSERSH